VQSGIASVVLEGEPREDLGAKVAFEMFKQAGIEVFQKMNESTFSVVTTWA